MWVEGCTRGLAWKESLEHLFADARGAMGLDEVRLDGEQVESVRARHRRIYASRVQSWTVMGMVCLHPAFEQTMHVAIYRRRLTRHDYPGDRLAEGTLQGLAWPARLAPA